jgi:hypothetical protein
MPATTNQLPGLSNWTDQYGRLTQSSAFYLAQFITNNFTPGGFIYVNANGKLVATTTAATDGQLLIGGDLGNPQLNTLTAGTGIGIVNGNGSITINNDGVLSVNGTTDQISVAPTTGNVIVSLPSTIIAPGSVTATTFMDAQTYNVSGSSPLPQNGLYLSANNTLSFSTNSTFSMQITPLQNVQIGGLSTQIDTLQQLQVTGNGIMTNINTGGVSLKLKGDGALTPSKTIAVTGGVLEILNDAGSAIPIASMTDTGALTVYDLNIKGIAPALLPLNGLYLSATNTLSLSTNSTYAAQISASQNLMLKGTTDTGQTLQVTGNSIFTNTTSGTLLTLVGNGATTPSKSIAVGSGVLSILNDALSATLLSITDAGLTTVTQLVSNSSIVAATEFGCNGKSAQGSYSLGPAATDLASVITLANNIRSALIANGIGA